MNRVEGDQELPLLEHVKELRRRMFVVFGVLFAVMMVAFPFSGNLIGMIWADLLPPGVRLVVYTPLEWMLTRLMLSLVIALAAAVPILIYESYAFMRKGLYPGERSFFLVIVPTSFILFMAGMGTAYYLVIPLIFNYMVFYSQDVAASGLSVKQTFSIVSSMLIIFGLIFQFPLFVLTAIKSGLVGREQLKNKRPIVYGVLVAFALFVAPDITGMSQLIMAFFLVLLFEVSLQLSRLI